MIQQLSQAVSFEVFYTSSGIGKTSLTVTVDVYNAAGTKIVSDGAATEVGGGFYRYTLSGTSTGSAGNYRAVFKTSDTSVDQRHLPSLWVIGSAWVERLDAAVSSRASASAAEDIALGVDTINDKVDNLPTIDDFGAAVWGEPKSSHTDPDTMGGVLLSIAEALAEGSGLTEEQAEILQRIAASVGTHGGTNATVSGDIVQTMDRPDGGSMVRTYHPTSGELEITNTPGS